MAPNAAQASGRGTPYRYNRQRGVWQFWPRNGDGWRDSTHEHRHDPTRGPLDPDERAYFGAPVIIGDDEPVPDEYLDGRLLQAVDPHAEPTLAEVDRLTREALLDAMPDVDRDTTLYTHELAQLLAARYARDFANHHGEV